MTSSMSNEIKQQIAASISVKEAVLANAQIIMQLESLVKLCIKSLKAGGKIIFAGNGGSFADAQHLSAEFTSRFIFNRAPLSSLALGTNNSAISAIGNDYGYEQVFSRELQAIAKLGDIFIPITTSGNSSNIITAVEMASEMGIVSIGWTGQNGGRLKQLCECLCVPSTETPRIQECHILIGHILCGMVEAEYFHPNGREKA